MEGSTQHCERLKAYRILGQSRPFVDRNLQIQLPGSDILEETNQPQISLFSHYLPLQTPLTSCCEEELMLNQMMEDVEKSFRSWKEMVQELHMH